MDAILTKQAAFYGPASAQTESSKLACELRKRLRAGTLPTTEVIRFLALHEPAFRDTANAARANCRREARAARNGGPTPTFDDDGGDDAHG